MGHNMAVSEELEVVEHQQSLNCGDFDMIEFKPLSNDFAKLSGFSSGVWWLSLLVILLIANIFFLPISLPFIIFPPILLLATISAIYSYYFVESCGYHHGRFELMYKQGLWWRKQTSLSFSRIQHIDISHGPLERRYELATIKFFTAGGVSSDLKIPGLPKNIANKMRDEILALAESDYLAEKLESHVNKANIDSTANEIADNKLMTKDILDE
jgi:uncharacterized protein